MSETAVEAVASGIEKLGLAGQSPGARLQLLIAEHKALVNSRTDLEEYTQCALYKRNTPSEYDYLVSNLGGVEALIELMAHPDNANSFDDRRIFLDALRDKKHMYVLATCRRNMLIATFCDLGKFPYILEIIMKNPSRAERDEVLDALWRSSEGAQRQFMDPSRLWMIIKLRMNDDRFMRFYLDKVNETWPIEEWIFKTSRVVSPWFINEILFKHPTMQDEALQKQYILYLAGKKWDETLLLWLTPVQIFRIGAERWGNASYEIKVDAMARMISDVVLRKRLYTRLLETFIREQDVPMMMLLHTTLVHIVMKSTDRDSYLSRTAFAAADMIRDMEIFEKFNQYRRDQRNVPVGIVEMQESDDLSSAMFD